MNFSEKTIIELEDFGFEKRAYESARADVYILKDGDLIIECSSNEFLITQKQPDGTSLETPIGLPPSLEFVKLCYKQLTGKELEKRVSYNYKWATGKIWSSSHKDTYTIVDISDLSIFDEKTLVMFITKDVRDKVELYMKLTKVAHFINQSFPDIDNYGYSVNCEGVISAIGKSNYTCNPFRFRNKKGAEVFYRDNKKHIEEYFRLSNQCL